mgnify:CR=1 FL=1
MIMGSTMIMEHFIHIRIEETQMLPAQCIDPLKIVLIVMMMLFMVVIMITIIFMVIMAFGDVRLRSDDALFALMEKPAGPDILKTLL